MNLTFICTGKPKRSCDSLYCRGLEPSLQYLRGMLAMPSPVRLAHRNDKDTRETTCERDLGVIGLCLPVVFNYFFEHFRDMCQWLVPQSPRNICGWRELSERSWRKVKPLRNQLQWRPEGARLGERPTFPGPWNPSHHPQADPCQNHLSGLGIKTC